jgi:hypothetical protein
MGLRRALLCTVLCLCGALPASAYVVRDGADGATLRWPATSLPVRYRVGVSGLSEDDEALTAAAVRAFQAWNRAPGSYFRFRYAGRTNAVRAAPDGENCMIWVVGNWPYKPETIAYTTAWVDGSGRIVEADIELNAEAFAWSPFGAASAVDVQNAVTHECGHVLGLAHSLETTEATMFPVILLGEVLKRSLGSDDVEGVRALYPVLASEMVLYEPAGTPPGALRPVVDRLFTEGPGSTPSIVLRADVDGDGTDEFGVFRGGVGDERGSFSLLKPGDDNGDPLLVAYDEWEIPAGGVEDAAALDVDGDGLDELVVLKYDWLQASQEVDVYAMPAWGAVAEADARPPIARDAWRIPEGNNLLALFAVRAPDGGRLGVVRATALGGLELELVSPPRPGDMTPEDAARGERVTVVLPQGFAMTDIDAADLDGDGVDEVLVLDQSGSDATVRAYDVILHPDGLALMLKQRWSLPVEQLAGQRALGLIGLDLDGSGLDYVGILHVETQ